MAILALVVLAVAAIFLFFGRDNQLPAGQQEVAPEEPAIVAETAEEAKFEPAGDPYNEYLVARNANKPIVIEFYARW